MVSILRYCEPFSVSPGLAMHRPTGMAGMEVSSSGKARCGSSGMLHTKSCNCLQVLEEANKQPDAAVAYLACGRKRDALRCYEVAGEWEMAMALLLQQSPPPAPAAVQKFARGLVDSLQATGRHEDAGTVAATYLKDARAAVQCFVAGGCWRAAYGAISQAGSGALLREVLAPAAAAAAEAHLRELREDAGRVDKYWQRLRQLREKREALAAAVGALRLPRYAHTSHGLACAPRARWPAASRGGDAAL